MKILPFALLGSALLVNHPSLAQTTPAQPTSPSPATPIAPGTEAAAVSAQAGGSATATAPARQITVSSLTEKQLKGQNDSDLGDIERVVENRADKKPYVVVSRGGVLGFFETEYLVPLDQLALSGDHIVAKNMTGAELENSEPLVDDRTYRSLDGTQTVSIPETP